MGTPDDRAMFCDHANEVPMACPCDTDCYCKSHTCKSVERAPRTAFDDFFDEQMANPYLASAYRHARAEIDVRQDFTPPSREFPSLKFAMAGVKLEDAAALLYTNWGGDRWGHRVLCSPVDYFSSNSRYRASTQRFHVWEPVSFWATLHADPNELIGVRFFDLQPWDEVPPGEVWLRSL